MMANTDAHAPRSSARGIWRLSALLLLVLNACQCHSCEDPLERERRELQAVTDRFDLRPYRAAKLAIRALPTPLLISRADAHVPPPGIRHDPKIARDVTATSAEMLTLLKTYIEAASTQQVGALSPRQTAELLAHTASLLADADEVDEDVFPLLIDQLCALSGCVPPERSILASEEHLALAFLIHESKQPLPISWSFYELSRIDIETFDFTIYRLALALYRSFLCAGNDWPHLAELDANVYLEAVEALTADDPSALLLDDIDLDDRVRFLRLLGHLNRAYIRELKDDDDGMADDLATSANLATQMSLQHWTIDVIAARGAAVGEDLDRARTLLVQARDQRDAPALIRGDIEDALEAVERGDAEDVADELSGRVFTQSSPQACCGNSCLPCRSGACSTRPKAGAPRSNPSTRCSNSLKR